MPVRVFFSYSHADEELRNQVEKQLAILKRQGVIETWHDRRIRAGEDFAAVIDEHIESDEVILLLVSADFLDSDYCYEIEMRRAMERHDAGEAIIIPVILRACDWKRTPFGKLNAVPQDGRPVTRWPDRDEALLQVANAVRDAADRWGLASPKSRRTAAPHAAAPRTPASQRSSNLALAKSFTERDMDRFKRESFDYMARFFESSLEELARRNDGVEADFRRVDADRFAATIYKGGEAAARCSVFVGDGVVGRGIAYSSSERFGGGFNELLTVESDDQALYLRSLGMSAVASGGRQARLSQEGAAELYWQMLVEPLQSRRR